MSAEHLMAKSSCLRLGKAMRQRRAQAARRAAEAEAARLAKLPPRRLRITLRHGALGVAMTSRDQMYELNAVVCRLCAAAGIRRLGIHLSRFTDHFDGFSADLKVPRQNAVGARLDLMRADRDVIDVRWGDEA